METNRMTIIRNNPQPRLAASVAYGDLLFLSGQTPKSNEDDIVLQTREVLEKIDALLAAAGSDKQHILSAQIWLYHHHLLSHKYRHILFLHYLSAYHRLLLSLHTQMVRQLCHTYRGNDTLHHLTSYLFRLM